MARWRIASSYQELLRGDGHELERTPMDYLISQGYTVIYHEAYEEEGVKRWIFYRLHDGAEVAVEKRWGKMRV